MKSSVHVFTARSLLSNCLNDSRTCQVNTHQLGCAKEMTQSLVTGEEPERVSLAEKDKDKITFLAIAV